MKRDEWYAYRQQLVENQERLVVLIAGLKDRIEKRFESMKEDPFLGRPPFAIRFDGETLVVESVSYQLLKFKPDVRRNVVEVDPPVRLSNGTVVSEIADARELNSSDHVQTDSAWVQLSWFLQAVEDDMLTERIAP